MIRLTQTSQHDPIVINGKLFQDQEDALQFARWTPSEHLIFEPQLERHLQQICEVFHLEDMVVALECHVRESPRSILEKSPFHLTLLRNQCILAEICSIGESEEPYCYGPVPLCVLAKEPQANTLFNLNSKSNSNLLYYGTTLPIALQIFQGICRLEHSRNNTDFARCSAFYCTPDLEYAKQLALRKAQVFGGDPAIVEFHCTAPREDGVELDGEDWEEWVSYCTESMTRWDWFPMPEEYDKVQFARGPVSDNKEVTQIAFYDDNYMDGHLNPLCIHTWQAEFLFSVAQLIDLKHALHLFSACGTEWADDVDLIGATMAILREKGTTSFQFLTHHMLRMALGALHFCAFGSADSPETDSPEMAERCRNLYTVLRSQTDLF